MTQQYTVYQETPLVYMTTNGKYLQFYCPSGWDPNGQRSAREVDTLEEASVVRSPLHANTKALSIRSAYHDDALKAVREAIPLLIREERKVFVLGAIPTQLEQEETADVRE